MRTTIRGAGRLYEMTFYIMPDGKLYCKDFEVFRN